MDMAATTDSLKKYSHASGKQEFQKIVFVEISSCLSPEVHNLFCNLGVSSSFNDILTPNNILDWEKLKCLLGVSNSKCLEWYKTSVMQLSPVMNYVAHVYEKLSVTDFVNCFGNHLLWTHNKKIFIYAFELLLNNASATSSVLANLLLTASIEKAIGNVYLLKGKQIPYLLKDLLSTSELEELFGIEGIQVLQTIMGPPISLNLRNILWHGFAAPMEVDRRYGFFLIAIAVALSEKLNQQHIKYSSIPIQKFVDFDNCSDIKNIFPVIEDCNTFKISNIFEHSPIVLPKMKLYWYDALQEYKEARYGNCLTLLIPQLENCLRVLFTSVNYCPERTLTAESSELYTTFEEIFDEFLDSGEKNLLRVAITDNYLELLFDILLHSEGPRIRDKLSHGEFEFSNIPQYLVSHVLCVSAVICLRFISKDYDMIQDEYYHQLVFCSKDYETRFHPVSLLKKEILEFITNLNMWDSCPHLEPEELCLTMNFDSTHVQEMIWECVTLIEQIYQLELANLRWNSFSDGLEDYVRIVTKHRVITVYRPSIERKVTTILRNIVFHAKKSSHNVHEVLHFCYTAWNNKLLRSRQRATYTRLIASLPVLYSGLRMVLIFLVAHFVSLNSASTLSTERKKQIFKLLKSTLYYMENLHMSKSNKNRWKECAQMTVDFIQQLLDSLKYFAQLPA